MRLGTLLVIGSLTAALPPLVLLGVAATEVATRAVTARVLALHAQEADNLASFIDGWILGRAQAITLLRQAFPLEELSDEGRVGFERLVYNQMEEANVVLILDPDGHDVVPSQRVAPGAAVPAGHVEVDDARLEAFRAHLPPCTGGDSTPVLGQPYLPPGGDAAVAALVLPGADPDGFALAVEISLAPIESRLAGLTRATTEVALLDRVGQPFARAGQALIEPERFAWFLDGVPAAQLEYRLEGGDKVLAAFSRVESTGWLAVVAEPWGEVATPARGIRLRAAWFGLVALGLAAVLGLHFARKLHRPVLDLRDAAQAVGEGRLGDQVVPADIHELRQLAEAFNAMSTRLARDAERIAAQQAEIHAFNAELQRRVEERTAELRRAQERLVESERQAAVAELGAGLAHELNNPLTSVLGLTQLLARQRAGTADAALLESMQQEVARCAEIVRSLLAFTEDGARRSDFGVHDLGLLLADVATLVRPLFRQRDRELRLTPPSIPLPVRADRARLGKALAQLASALRVLAPPGGGLEIGAAAEGDQILVELRLSGGAAGTPAVQRDDWLAAGMSLSIVRRILSEHDGRLREPAPGSCDPFLLLFPKA